MKILVAGDGAVAEATVTALLDQGHRVRVLSPDAEALARRWPHGVEASVGDVAASRHAQGTADGCQAVLHLAAVREPWATTATTGAASRASGPGRIDVRGTRWLVAEAERAGAERFVLLSSLRHERSPAGDGVLMREAEGVVRGFRGVWSILRAGLVYAPGEGALAALATMLRTMPAVPLVDGGRTELQPLWHEDLGRALAQAAQSPASAGRVLHVAGPERMGLSEITDRLSAFIGRHPVRVPVPGLLASLGPEAAAMLGLPLPARAGALAELDGESRLPDSVENALTAVLGVKPTLIEDGLRALVGGVPEQTPPPGDDAIRRRRFWVDIEGSTRRARALRDVFRRHATHVLKLEGGPPEGLLVKKGALLSARVPLRGFVALRVAEIDPETVTALTVEGDPLAGIVTLRFRDQGQGVRVEIVVDAGATNPVDRVLAAAIGGALEDLDWPGALERIVALSGGRAPAGLQRDVKILEADEADEVRRRAEKLRLARKRAEAPPIRPGTDDPASAPSRPPARRARPRTSGGPRSRDRGPAPR
ncbi:MAG TPA: NAD(P)H-binding protein [Vicinamibacteria bacterium]|nr:NAD(P)H-binding protein [Vicinamibacteria bacterium]